MTADYLFPSTVEEAIAMVRGCGGAGRIIAGGTDLLLEVREGRREVASFVDITRIPELAGVRELDDGRIWIGATTTHRQAWESPLIQARAPLLAEACHSVAALQIQSVGTLGGNVVNAMPAADASVALTALDAEVEIASCDGLRWTSLCELFTRPGVCKVEPTAEILTAFRFAGLGRREGCAYERLARRRALVLPMLNCAVVARLNDGGDRILEARIVLAPVAPVPYRARGAEALLAGVRITPEALRAAAEQARAESQPRDNVLRAGAAYRKDMVAVLTRRALERAVERARG